ncbi:hypothetical protein ACLB2K_016869 [Fragaria x ananassa]
MSSATLSSNFLQTGCQWKGGVKNLEGNKRNAGKVFVQCSVNSKTQKAEKQVRLGVLGASGYTGSEDLPKMVAIKDADFSDVDAVFCCLPHGTTQEIIKGLPKSLNICNLVNCAGRGAKEANLYTEIAEGLYSYGITCHRHVPEIEQGLSGAANSKVTVSFTPHLMPMSRGMQSTIYVEMAPGVEIKDLRQQLRLSYEDEEFVVLLEDGVVPRTHNTRGSNYCFINVFPDRISGRAIIISVIDNLVKGASGQALQNLNVMMGFPESTGLLYQPLFP